MLRKDVPLFQVSDFQVFDKGASVSQLLRGDFQLSPGDKVVWEAGSKFWGHAEIVSAEKPDGGWTRVVMKKIF